MQSIHSEKIIIFLFALVQILNFPLINSSSEIENRWEKSFNLINKKYDITFLMV